jgi:hypothetical protein
VELLRDGAFSQFVCNQEYKLCELDIIIINNKEGIFLYMLPLSLTLYVAFVVDNKVVY